MKKITLFKSLLVAVMLLTGASAWAQGNKRVLESENYETATASDWTCPNGSAVLKTGDATYGTYAQCYPSGSGNRSCYKSVVYDYEPDGFTTAEMTTAGYNIEFDFCIVSGNVEQRSVSQFVIPTTGPNLATNASYTGTDYIFSLSNSINFGKVDAGKSTDKNQVWFVNDLTNVTEKTVTLDENWYHMTMVVTATSVVSTISRGGATVVTDTKTVTTLPKITGFWKLLGRGSGKINFDNLEIYDYTASLTVSAPTFTFEKVDGANRVYTITNTEGGGTLYYTTAPANDAPAVGDAAYTSTTELNKEVVYSESGKYYAYVLHTNGITASTITEQTVTAGALTLAQPVFTVTDMVLAADGYYYPVVTFASNNSSLEGAPTATLDQTSPYTFTGVGSLTVTASAEGYTSSSTTFTVNHKYSLSKTIDFGALTAADFDATVWTEATGAPRDYWTNRAAAIPADVTYYKLTNTSTTAGNPDNSAVLNDITISNYYQRAPEVYIGYGLLTPYAALSGSGNNMNFTVNGATSLDYAVYNGWNNYGSGTFNTVQAGNANFALYRYDTMLRTIKVYSGDYSFGIVGDLTGGWDADVVMTQSAADKNIYTLVVDKFTATANTTYYYKLRADGSWDGYQLPGSGNNDYYFENAGVYKLTFTADIKANSLTLAVEENPDYTVVGSFNNDATPSFFGTSWDVNNADNLLTKNEDGTYTKTFNNVSLEAGTILYKVVKNHSWDTNWGFDSNNADYGVGAEGIYDITFTFNPTTKLSNGFNLTCDVKAIPTSVAKTISAAGYATYCSSYALDFSSTGLTAYIAKKDASNNVTFEAVTKVPANTGILLKGAEGEYNINTTADATDDVTDNVLVGVTADTKVAAGSFVLMSGADGVGFYKTTKEFTVGANTAYIEALPTTARFISLDTEGEISTGIETLKKENNVLNNEYYNLSGQRVVKPTKGLYIVNGKKMVIK